MAASAGSVRIFEIRCSCHRLLLMASSGPGWIQCKCPRCSMMSNFELTSSGGVRCTESSFRAVRVASKSNE